MQRTTTKGADMTAIAAKRDFATECNRRRDAGLKVFGAYALKDKLKAAGGIWDGQLRAWLIPDESVARQLDLIAKDGRHGRYYITAESAQRRREQKSGRACEARTRRATADAPATDRQLAALARMLRRLAKVQLFDSMHGNGAVMADEYQEEIAKGITRKRASAMMDEISFAIDDEM